MAVVLHFVQIEMAVVLDLGHLKMAVVLDWNHIELAAVLDCDQILVAAALVQILHNYLALLPALCGKLKLKTRSAYNLNYIFRVRGSPSFIYRKIVNHFRVPSKTSHWCW